jgi:hypothetical protein
MQRIRVIILEKIEDKELAAKEKPPKEEAGGLLAGYTLAFIIKENYKLFERWTF